MLPMGKEALPPWGKGLMRLIHRTSNKHRKLRWATAVTVASAVLALPAIASAKVTVSGYAVSSSLAPAPLGGYSIVEPAIAPAPDGSDAEWFVVSGTRQSMLSISPTGQQSSVASGLASDDGTPVNYASVDADGYDWVDQSSDSSAQSGLLLNARSYNGDVLNMHRLGGSKRLFWLPLVKQRESQQEMRFRRVRRVRQRLPQYAIGIGVVPAGTQRCVVNVIADERTLATEPSRDAAQCHAALPGRPSLKDSASVTNGGHDRASRQTRSM